MKMVTSLGRVITMQHSSRFWSNFHPWGELGEDAWDQQVVEEGFKHWGPGGQDWRTRIRYPTRGQGSRIKEWVLKNCIVWPNKTKVLFKESRNPWGVGWLWQLYPPARVSTSYNNVVYIHHLIIYHLLKKMVATMTWEGQLENSLLHLQTRLGRPSLDDGNAGDWLAGWHNMPMSIYIHIMMCYTCHGWLAALSQPHLYWI